MADKRKLTPRGEDFAAWYNEVVLRAELADYSPVRGSMVIRPWGYGIWENMQAALDRRFKDTGHENAYFPLLIPMSFIEKEKAHVEGFKPELAVVTHAGGKELEESLVIRPTSETIVYHMYARWVQSYRDLPVLMNQWANVMRWELRTRLFLRTAEFLWQEGHTAHATSEEAEQETQLILGLYKEFMERWIAMPVLTGLKTESEKFAGAVRSYSCEALMQDNRALQAGTSHFLGQNFSKQFDLKFQSVEGKDEYAWNTSWGVSTRMVGGMVMTHGDDQGIVVPPRLAPVQVVIVPIMKGGDAKATAIHHKADELAGMLTAQHVRARVDHRDYLSPGAKFYEWERKGVPFRLELGPKDLDKEQVVLVRRVAPHDGPRKEFLPHIHATTMLPERLEAFQRELLARAARRREENSFRGVTDWGEMKEILDTTGGFVYTGWSGDPAVAQRAKEEMKATIRVIPDQEFQSGTAPSRCIGGSGASRMEVVWARAY
jgi:prolyl-tRNA synthetase